MERVAQTVRTNLFLFVWLFLTIFFVACLFVAYWMDWRDERLVVLLAGAVGASLQSIAMLTSTATKGGNRVSDLTSGATVDATTTITTKTESVEEVTTDKEKQDEKNG